ncbi:MAG: GGDEF domain-containing protein [Aquificaceae bacterium]|nr:GGDEF domain-containing protein [Aquificaceae bacterium]
MEIALIDEKDLKGYIPSVAVDKNYNLITMNATARRMFGEAVGEKCYRVLYGFSEPCYRMGIKCPIRDGTDGIDVISVNYESYIRGYGRLPEKDTYWESLINITSVEVLRSSIVDPLSDLYNRRFGESFLEKSFKLWERYRQPFVLMFIDLDNFKEINDTYGHLMGDRVIQKLASYLKITLRSSDTACRYGGDEFLVILPNTSLEAGKVVASRVHSCSDCLQFPFFLSVSIGLAQPMESDRCYTQVLERADRAMYQAKKAGGGKTGIAISREEFHII